MAALGKQKARQQTSPPRTTLERLISLQMSLNKDLQGLTEASLRLSLVSADYLSATTEIKAGLEPKLPAYSGEGFAADEVDFLLMMPRYILEATRDEEGRCAESWRCWRVLK